MRRAWFVYQVGSKHPMPAIIYDNLPDDAAGKDSSKPKILQTVELTEEWPRGHNGEIMASFFGLKTAYPYTGDAYNIGPKVNLDHRECVLVKTTNALLAELG